MNLKSCYNTAKNMFLVLLGTVILAFGSAVFIIPFELVTGGMSGIAIVIERIVNIEFITVDIIISVLSWGLFFLGLITLGKGFAVKTLISTIAYPVCVSLFLRLVSPGVLGGYCNLSNGEYEQIALILAATVGGALVGTGSAIAFLGGGSTGGTDIIAFVVCRIFPKLKTSKLIFIIDAIIVVIGMFVIENLVISLMGIISALVCAAVIDRVFLGGSRAFIANIVSDRWDKINAVIIERFERTSTVLEGIGAYSGKSKKIIMVSFTMSEYSELLGIINQIDKNAFVTIHRAHEINGEGWTR